MIKNSNETPNNRSVHDALVEKAKKFAGNKDGKNKEERLGEFRALRDLYLSELSLPKFSNISLTVFEMPIKEVDPFLEESSIKEKKRQHGDIDKTADGENRRIIQNRAKIIYEILKNGIDGYKYGDGKEVYHGEKNGISQFLFEYEYAGVPLSIIVVNMYSNAIYITKKQLVINRQYPRTITRAELQDPKLTIKLYGKKDEEIFNNPEFIRKKLTDKIHKLLGIKKR